MNLLRNLQNDQWDYLQLWSSLEKFPEIVKVCCCRQWSIKAMLMYAVNYVKVLHSHQNYLCEGHHLSCILPSGYFLSSSFQHINILNLANCCLTEILSALGFHDGIVSLLSFEPLPLLFLFWILLHLIANVGVLLNSVMGQLIFPPCIFTLSDLISFSNFK